MKLVQRTLAGIMLVALLAGTGYLLQRAFEEQGGMTPRSIGGDFSCATATAVRVEGASMEPVLAAGSELTAWEGYYRCNPVNRGDIITYRYSEHQPAIVKFIIATPGDALVLRTDGEAFNLLVNGEVTMTASGEPYRFNAARAAVLRLYLDAYAGIVPADRYVILGNDREGSFDSSQFGFISKEGLIARVEGI